jgi:hypothetical protein
MPIFSVPVNPDFEESLFGESAFIGTAVGVDPALDISESEPSPVLTAAGEAAGVCEQPPCPRPAADVDVIPAVPALDIVTPAVCVCVEDFVDGHGGRSKRVPHEGGPCSKGFDSAKAAVLNKARSQTNTTDLNMFGARINSERE